MSQDQKVFVVTNKLDAKRVFVVNSTNPRIGTYVIEIPPHGKEVIDTSKYAIEVNDLYRKLNWALQLGYIDLKVYSKDEYEQLQKESKRPSKRTNSKQIAQVLSAKTDSKASDNKSAKEDNTQEQQKKVEEDVNELKSMLKEVKQTKQQQKEQKTDNKKTTNK